MVESLLARLAAARAGRIPDAGPPPRAYTVASLAWASSVDDTAPFDAFSRGWPMAPRLAEVSPKHSRPRRTAESSGLGIQEGAGVENSTSSLEIPPCWTGTADLLTNGARIREGTDASGVPCLTRRYQIEPPFTVSDGLASWPLAAAGRLRPCDGANIVERLALGVQVPEG